MGAGMRAGEIACGRSATSSGDLRAGAGASDRGGERVDQTDRGIAHCGTARTRDHERRPGPGARRRRGRRGRPRRARPAASRGHRLNDAQVPGTLLGHRARVAGAEIIAASAIAASSSSRDWPSGSDRGRSRAMRGQLSAGRSTSSEGTPERDGASLSRRTEIGQVASRVSLPWLIKSPGPAFPAPPGGVLPGLRFA